jgi:flagellar assembly factor FliW
VRLDEEGLLYALTSADDPELRFLVAPPATLFPDYTPEIDDNSLELLGNPTADQILTMVVITAGEEQTSANLLAPIVINQQNLTAVQVILTGTGMPVRQLLTAGAA